MRLVFQDLSPAILRSVKPTAPLLRQAGWTINDKRVERIWQREGLKVPHHARSRSMLSAPGFPRVARSYLPTS